MVFVETVVVSKAVFAMEINFQKKRLEVPLEVLCSYATFQPLKNMSRNANADVCKFL